VWWAGILLRDRWRGWEHPWVSLSLAYRLVRSMLGVLAVLALPVPKTSSAQAKAAIRFQ
jgi:hypothetical protein